MPIDSLPPLSEVIRTYDLRAKKSLGQHYLSDFNILHKIVSSAGDIGDATVLEIGSGPGGLTRALLSTGARVFAVERDERCLPALQDIRQHYPETLHILCDDALHSNFLPRLRDFSNGTPIHIISNLPYNIATKLFVNWLSSPFPFFWSQMILMFQSEVANRICSSHGEKHWGRLGLLSSLLTHCDILFDLPPSVFTPPPKVISSVVRVVPNTPPPSCDLQLFERVSQSAFGQRRKMLRQSLKSLGGEELLNHAGIDPTLRAQDLSLSDFLQLTNSLSHFTNRVV